MDWPARRVIQKGGKTYVKLSELDADDLLKILQEHLKMSLQNQIIVRGEGEDGDAMVCCKSYLLQISTYFRSFVERWNEDEAASTPEIKLENIRLDVFKGLVELASTGLLKMGGHSDLATLVGAANFLQMENLSSRFSEFIRDEMKNYNSSLILWSYMTPEEFHGYVGLSEEASKLVKSRFEYILATCSEQLMDMSGKQWLDIISDPALFVISEDVLLRTLCRWVAVDPAERSDDFIAMAKYIRGGCLSRNLLAELRDEPSTASVVRMFVASINDTSESQPRTIEVVAFLPYGIDAGDEGMLCFDPFARSPRFVSLTNKFDAEGVLYRAGCVSPGNIIYMFRDGSLGAVDPIIDNWIPKVADRIPDSFLQLPQFAAAAYLDGFVYMALWNGEHFERGIFEADCSDMNSRDVRKILHAPGYLHDHHYVSLIGFCGKIHIFARNYHYSYDPSIPSKSWSAGSPITPTFGKFPQSCCVGPDGMIYIQGKGETRLWIFNAATSEFRISAECAETLREVMNVENKIICVVESKKRRSLGTWVYDHVKDLWAKRRKSPIDVNDVGKFLPVRLLASSFDLFPQKSAKRPLED